MKVTPILTASIAALTLGVAAQAATVIHITGSTAFRASTIQAIENLYILNPLAGGNYVGAGTIAAPTGPAISAGKFKCTYTTYSSPSTIPEQGATYVVFEGNVSGLPAGANPVIFKTAWAGSTGGLITTANNIDITWTAANGFLSANTLTGAECSISTGDPNVVSLASAPGNYTGDGDTGKKADLTMADSQQGSAGVSGLNVTGASGDGIAGVVPFEWVASTGVTAPVKFTGCASGGGAVITYTGAIYTPTGAAATAAQIAAVAGGPCGGSNIARNDLLVGAPTGLPPGSFTLTSAPTGAVGASYVAAVTGTNPITNINVNQAFELIAGGMFVSQFTGTPVEASYTIANKPVYLVGRNFDSGTRLSELAETGIGVFGVQQSVCPTFVGGSAYPIAFPNGGTGGAALGPNASGGADQYITKLDLWAAESIFPAPYTTNYVLGNSGYNGGGALAGCLATPGALSAPATGVASAPLWDADNSGVPGQHGGWLVGYLGRPDAKTACKTTTGANTAHRINFNGVADWTGGTGDAAMGADGGVTYDNATVQEGQYQAWEVEYLYENPLVTSGSNKDLVASALTDLLRATPTSAAGINYDDMHVAKASEGAPIYHK